MIIRSINEEVTVELTEKGAKVLSERNERLRKETKGGYEGKTYKAGDLYTDQFASIMDDFREHFSIGSMACFCNLQLANTDETPVTLRKRLEKLVSESSLFDVMDMLSDICIDMSVQKGTSVPDYIAIGLRALKSTAQATLDELGQRI